MRNHFKPMTLLAAGALALALAASPNIASAVDSPSPSAEPTKPPPKPPAKAQKKKPPKKEKQTEQQFIDGYQAAHATIYRQHDFNRGIAMLRALGRDERGHDRVRVEAGRETADRLRARAGRGLHDRGRSGGRRRRRSGTTDCLGHLEYPFSVPPLAATAS